MQFIFGMESCEMNRNIGAEICDYPFGHFFDLVHVVVECWNDEDNNFEPHIGVRESFQCFQYGFQLAAALLAVKLLGESLEVHFVGGKHRKQCFLCFFVNIAIAYHDALNANIFSCLGTVNYILCEDCWFVVGVGNGSGVKVFSKSGYVFRG